MTGQTTGQTLGTKVRDLREAKGLTVEQLAVYAQLSVATVSRIERGVVKPNRSTLYMLAGALDCDPVEFGNPDLPEAA